MEAPRKVLDWQKGIRNKHFEVTYRSTIKNYEEVYFDKAIEDLTTGILNMDFNAIIEVTSLMPNSLKMVQYLLHINNL